MLKPEEEEELIGEDSAISADESTENSSAQNQTEHQVSVHDASALTDVFLWHNLAAIQNSVSNPTSATSPSSQATIVDDSNIIFVWAGNVEEAFREIGQIVQTVYNS